MQWSLQVLILNFQRNKYKVYKETCKITRKAGKFCRIDVNSKQKCVKRTDVTLIIMSLWMLGCSAKCLIAISHVTSHFELDHIWSQVTQTFSKYSSHVLLQFCWKLKVREPLATSLKWEFKQIQARIKFEQNYEIHQYFGLDKKNQK